MTSRGLAVDVGFVAGARQSQQSVKVHFYTVAEVAEFVGVSVRSVRRWIKSGELVAHHFGTAVRIAESDLKAFIARCDEGCECCG